MNSMIKPLLVGSFALMVAGACPHVSLYVSLVGLISLMVVLGAGLYMFGSEAKDWDRVMAKIELDRQYAQSKIDESATAVSRAEATLRASELKVSKALADLRSENRRGPLSE